MRQDLTPGYQSAQSIHAAIEFSMRFKSETYHWYTTSNYVSAKSIATEEKLEKLAQKAEQKNIKVIRFFEPDIGNQLTAISLEPSDETRKLTAHLPNMLSEFGTERIKVA